MTVNIFEQAHERAKREYKEITGLDYNQDELRLLHVGDVPISSQSLYIMLEGWELSRISPEYRKVAKDMEEALIYGKRKRPDHESSE